MKTRYMVLIVLFFVFMGGIRSQGYFPFPDSSAVWRTNWATIDCMQSPFGYSQYQYLLTGDTLIGGTHYVKVTRSGYISFDCSPYTLFNHPNGYQGAYRQDVSAKKVFLMPPDSTHEILFYDFTLNIGDTIKGYFSLDGLCPNLIIDQSDSILIGASYRKRFHVIAGGGICRAYFIEGIGSTNGLFENLVE